jgi:S-adenosylmethionine synthetase
MSMQNIAVLVLTQTLTGTVAANRFVTPAGSQAGADANALGVARSAGVSGDRIPVEALGTSIVETGGSFSAGATIKSDASGRAIVWATSGAKLAVAREASTGSGQFVEVFLIPNVA